jgi:isoquinoline 1-oxidoreductase beta subunit
MTSHLPATLGRRQFLQVSLLAGSGLLLTVELNAATNSSAANGRDSTLNAYIRMDASGAITLVMPKAEMGQGIYTALAMLIAEELEVSLDQVTVEAAPPNPAVYGVAGDQSTGGSTSVRDCWLPLRTAGATARMLLTRAGAQTWRVPVSECVADAGYVIHPISARRLSYGALVAKAATLPAPRHVPLKDAKDFKLIGHSTRRLESPSKTDGTARFGIDVRLPQMRYAMVALSPVEGGSVALLDTKAALSITGVRQVINERDVVAVVADHTYAAMQGLAALKIQWNSGPHGHVQQATLVAELEVAVHQKGGLARSVGNPQAALKGATHIVEALYHQPFLAHATMEPMNCTVHWRSGQCEIWVGTQAPSRVVEKLASLGLTPENIILHNHLIGGGFGRRLDVDTVVIAARIAKHVSTPLQVIWSRSEDIQHDRYRPYYVDHLKAGLDAQGSPVSWMHTIAGGSATAAWDGKPLKNGVDDDAVDSAANPAYQLPALSVRYVRHDPTGIPISWWRGVGPTRSVFVVESFIDELAFAASQDPIDYRRPLCKDERLRAVLNLVANKSNWGAPLPAGHGRGVSIQAAFGSYLAQVVEVSAQADGSIRVIRVVCAMDCGQQINPEGIHAQLESGVIFGLTAALMGEVTVTNGRIEQSNFDNYPVLRLAETPLIETHLITNSEAPGGVGETGTSCIAAAVCNAVFSATGRRVRTLPINKHLAS